MNFMRPLVYLRSLQNTDPLEGTQREKACLQYVPGLQTDPNELCHFYFTLYHFTLYYYYVMVILHYTISYYTIIMPFLFYVIFAN